MPGLKIERDNLSKMYQIREDDLCELERVLPELHVALGVNTTPAVRTKLRRVKTILSNVRWDYGPHENVENVDDE